MLSSRFRIGASRVENDWAGIEGFVPSRGLSPKKEERNVIKDYAC